MQQWGSGDGTANTSSRAHCFGEVLQGIRLQVGAQLQQE